MRVAVIPARAGSCHGSPADYSGSRLGEVPAPRASLIRSWPDGHAGSKREVFNADRKRVVVLKFPPPHALGRRSRMQQRDPDGGYVRQTDCRRLFHGVERRGDPNEVLPLRSHSHAVSHQHTHGSVRREKAAGC